MRDTKYGVTEPHASRFILVTLSFQKMTSRKDRAPIWWLQTHLLEEPNSMTKFSPFSFPNNRMKLTHENRISDLKGPINPEVFSI